ncbi:MAG: glycosyltransferase family 4 protein [Elusimicrobia bacterium]|nr:glycosyltransferase family 4 protein [Elusimicrobiota bacterium]
MIDILVIAPRYGTIDRGMESFFPQFMSRFDPSRFRFTVLSAPHGLPPSDRIRFVQRPTLRREIGVRLYRIKPLGRLLKLLKFKTETHLESFFLMLASAPYLLRHSFDIVMPSGGPWTYVFAARLCGARARIVSLGHAGPSRSELVRSDLFIAITPADEEEAKRIWHPIATQVIPSATDVSRFGAAGPRPNRKPKVILCVAALEAFKRHDLLFDAAEVLGEMGEDVIVLCHGRGPHKARLMRHPLYLKGKVRIDESRLPDVARCYEEADVFSLASPEETFGLVFTEALACGLNVVAHDAPRQRFVVGESGFFCDVFNRQAYAEALRNALNTGRREQNVAQAKRFDFSAAIPRYEALFESLAASAGRPALTATGGA